MALEDDLIAQEAARLAAKLGVTGTLSIQRVQVAQGGPEILALLAELEAAEGPPPAGEPLRVVLPAPISPSERGERFEGPVARALGELGEVEGGGTECREVDGRLEILSVDFVVHVRDVARCLPILRRVLREQGAPVGTTIRQSGPTELVHTLG